MNFERLDYWLGVGIWICLALGISMSVYVELRWIGWLTAETPACLTLSTGFLVGFVVSLFSRKVLGI